MNDNIRTILETSFSEYGALSEATGTLLETLFLKDVSEADYHAFIKKHEHIFKAEEERTSRIHAAVMSDLATLKDARTVIHSRPWRKSEVDKLYADFYERLHGYECWDKLINYANGEVDRLKDADAELIDYNEWIKSRKLREEKAEADNGRKKEEGYKRQAKAIRVEIEQVVMELMSAGVISGKP
jgi:5-methylthioribose kinase